MFERPANVNKTEIKVFLGWNGAKPRAEIAVERDIQIQICTHNDDTRMFVSEVPVER